MTPLSLAFARPQADAELQVPFLLLLARGHRCYAALEGGGAILGDALLSPRVGCRSWRQIVATITAFTVAHSLTLLGAAMGLVRLPGLLVEATIAGSIVAVAVANLLQRGRAAHRWPWAFGFGLVHGFGFAGVLADLDITGATPGLLPLLAFNFGVEIGQLAFALAVVPLLRFVARHPRGARVAPAVSLAVGLAGCWWLGERLLAA